MSCFRFWVARFIREDGRFVLFVLSMVTLLITLQALGFHHSATNSLSNPNLSKAGQNRGGNPLPRFAPRHILVKLKPRADVRKFLRIARRQGLRLKGQVYGMPGWLRVAIPKGSDPCQVAARVRRLSSDVLLATPDPLVRINDTIPCDPFFKDDPDPANEPCDPSEDPNCDITQLVDQWGLFKVGAPQAWDVERGSPNVVIAILDSGMDLDHDDLWGNVWTNPNDPPDGVDNDGNGFVDDVHGADFVGDNVGNPTTDDPNSQDPNPDIPMGGKWVEDPNAVPFGVRFVGDPAVGDAVDNDGDRFLIDAGVFHGTFVAGIVGAMTDNINPDTGQCEGIAGTAWHCKLMPVRIINAEGWGFGSDAASAIVYAADMGAHIINCSWGISITDDPEVMEEIQIIAEAIRYAVSKGIIVVAAAGNSGSPGTGTTGLDFPAIMKETISVGASNWLDQRSEFSSTALSSEIPDNGVDDDGNGWVDDVLDVVAPGELIWSTYVLSAYDALLFLTLNPNSGVEPGMDTYSVADGTSFSTPLVSGYVALLLSRMPNATLEQVRAVIRSNALDLLDPNGAGQNLPGYDAYSGFGRVRMIVPPNEPPSLDLSPVNAFSVAGTLQTFTATYEDPNGHQDIAYAAIRVLNSVLAAAYVPATNRLYLLDDAGNRWLGGYPPGSSNAIRNRQGLLDCQNTTVSKSGNALIIRWSFIPDGNWVGTTQRVYLFAEDKAGERAGWEQKGTWMVLENQGNFREGGQRSSPTTPHDVAVTNLSVSPASPKAGEDMTVSVTVANLGRNPERNLVFRLSVNGHVWFVERIGYIGAGLSLRGRYTLKAYPPAGVYKLRAEVLPVPLESNKANNALSLRVTVR